MLEKRQQGNAQGEIKNNRVKLKGFGVISELPQAPGFVQLPTYEIIQLMMFFDDGVAGFWFQTPWRFNVKLVERLINILHVNVRDIWSRALVLDSENCKIMAPLR